MLVGQGGQAEVDPQQGEQPSPEHPAPLKGEAGVEVESQQGGDDGEKLIHIVQLHRISGPHLVGGDQPHAAGVGGHQQGEAVLAPVQALEAVLRRLHYAEEGDRRQGGQQQAGVDGVGPLDKGEHHQHRRPQEQEGGEHHSGGVQGVSLGLKGLVVAGEGGVFAPAEQGQNRRHGNRKGDEGESGRGAGNG